MEVDFNSLSVFIFSFLFLICGNGASFRDGDLYKLTSLADDNVFTMTGKAGLSGSNVTAEPWQDGGNQKWLAVEAVSASDKYILIPKWQSWNWKDFTKDTTKERRDHIPDFTVVLGSSADSSSKIISLQGYTGKSSQQWKTIEGSNGGVLIKNLQDDKCICNPGEHTKSESKSNIKKVTNKITKIFGGHHDKKKTPGTLESIACDPTNPQQLWRVELIA